MNDVITVEKLANYLNTLVDKGCGDFVVNCIDGKIHENDIGVNITDKNVRLRGHLYHEDVFKKSKRLQDDIKSAINLFMEGD